MNRFWFLIAAFFLTGCSSKAIYENIQINNRNACTKEPPSQYEKCIERANKSYEEYERELKEYKQERKE